MSYSVYWGSGSPVSWRVLIALAIKNVDYDSRRLDLSAGDHRTPEFVGLSPRGTFPVLVDGETVVRDSLAIMVYLDGKHPEPPLFGADAAESAAIWETIGDHQDHLGAAVETITRGLFRKNGLADPEPVVGAVEKAYGELTALDRHLAQRDWLVGDSVTAADIVYYPTLHRLLRAAASEKSARVDRSLSPELPDHPGLAAWEQRVGALPGVAETYPPHWRSD